MIDPLKRTRSDVQEFGWHIVIIEKDDYMPGFCYTVGLWETYRHPELLVMGLRGELLQDLLRGAVKRIREGVALPVDTDVTGFISDYPIRFRHMHPSNVTDYMGHGLNYYLTYHQQETMPAMQLCWTDKEGRWPWDDEFKVPHQQIALDYERSFKFWLPENTAVFTSRQVFRENKPILFVTHHADGDWQFLHEAGEPVEDIMIVALGEIVQRDPSVNELFQLPQGYMAARAAPGEWWEWSVNPNDDEEE